MYPTAKTTDYLIGAAAATNELWWPANLEGWMHLALLAGGVLLVVSRLWLTWRRRDPSGDDE